MLVPKLLTQELLSDTLRTLYVKEENLGCTINNILFNNYSPSTDGIVDIIMIPESYEYYIHDESQYPVMWGGHESYHDMNDNLNYKRGLVMSNITYVHQQYNKI